MIITEALLSQNVFSRPGKKLREVKAIVVHYTASPGANAMAERNYFDSLKTQEDTKKFPTRSASAHEIVGLSGEIIRAIPLDEVAYHCGAAQYTPRAVEFFKGYCTPTSSPNHCTLGMEICHIDPLGFFTQETFSAAQQRVRELCVEFGLDPKVGVWRHYDVTKKVCPLSFVIDPNEWVRFLNGI